MRRSGNWFSWIFVFAIIALSLLDVVRDEQEVQEILSAADEAAEQLDLSVPQNSEQGGVVTANDQLWEFSTTELQQRVARMPRDRQHYFYMWSGNGREEITGSASGVDRLAYFANSFLVGFKPFDTDTVWQPMATIALRKSYILDHDLYGPGMDEIWQNSRQAYRYTRGDCEDHAIILADWLISLGHDARVVLGKFDNGGHAWVVLFKNGKEYIIEATRKRRPTSINDFILASMASDYRPMYQFNRSQFWVNTGSEYTVKYRDKKWALRSEFERRG